MGSIDKRPNGRWRARYRDPEGRQHAKHFERKADASQWLTVIESSKLTGSYVSPSSGKQTLGEYATSWAESRVHRPSTRAQVESHLKNHILPRFGERAIASIRPTEVQAWIRGLDERLAPSTVEVVYHYLAAIFKAAIADRVISVSPCTRDVQLPKVDRQRIEPLTTDQVLALALAVPARYRALVICAAGAGLRQGEAFGLTVDHVDFMRRSLRVEQQLIKLPGAPPQFGPPKTSSSHRTIPLPDIVGSGLAKHLATVGPGELNLVFTADDGAPLVRNRFSERVWRPAIASSGLPAGTRFHDLRHYYASLLIRQGESVKTVQAQLGHASADETLNTYSHLWPDSDERTRGAVDEELGRAAEDSVRTPGGSSVQTPRS